MNKRTTVTTIVNAAKTEFQKRGFPATTIEDIVEAAEVTESDFNECFNSLEDCCLKALKSYAQEEKRSFKSLDENDNCRQRLSLFIDNYYENAEIYAEEGHPVFNLYYDVRNMDNELSETVEEILEMQHEWIDEQFIIMLKTESAVDQGDRLMAALSGLLLLVKITGDAQMFRNQLIQLRSWIRSM